MLLLEFLNIPVEFGFSEPYIILPLWVAMLGICIEVPIAFFACVFFQVYVCEPVGQETGPAWDNWLDARYAWGPADKQGRRTKVLGMTGRIHVLMAFPSLHGWMFMMLVVKTIKHRSFSHGYVSWARLLSREFPKRSAPDQA